MSTCAALFENASWISRPDACSTADMEFYKLSGIADIGEILGSTWTSAGA